jgi:hypothetical protein
MSFEGEVTNLCKGKADASGLLSAIASHYI